MSQDKTSQVKLLEMGQDEMRSKVESLEISQVKSVYDMMVSVAVFALFWGTGIKTLFSNPGIGL